MGEFWSRVVAIIVASVVIGISGLLNWPLGASSEAEFWVRIIVGIAAMWAIGGLFFMLIVRTTFRRGVVEWVVINLALIGLTALLFPSGFQRMIG